MPSPYKFCRYCKPNYINYQFCWEISKVSTFISQVGDTRWQIFKAMPGRRTPHPPVVTSDQAPFLTHLALRFTAWAERWFPDALVFAAIAVALVGLATLANGAAPQAVARAFGDGFWSLIVFAMQIVLVAIGGYAVATSPRPRGCLSWLGRHMLQQIRL